MWILSFFFFLIGLPENKTKGHIYIYISILNANTTAFYTTSNHQFSDKPIHNNTIPNVSNWSLGMAGFMDKCSLHKAASGTAFRIIAFFWHYGISLISSDIISFQWIGLRENLQESPIFHGKSIISCRFSLKPIHWIIRYKAFWCRT